MLWLAPTCRSTVLWLGWEATTFAGLEMDCSMNDVHEFDTATCTWRQLRPTGGSCLNSSYLLSS